MSIPVRLAEFLHKNNAPYEVIQHPVKFTAQELSAVEHVSGKRHAKVVMIALDGEWIMAVLPSNHRVDLELLVRLTGKRAALASESEFDKLFPDCERGSMPPFGNLYGVPTFVDRSLVCDDSIVFEAGTHTQAIRMLYSDFERLAKPTIGDFSAKAH
jgi:Ala-tRNA(Pro) deacylase